MSQLITVRIVLVSMQINFLTFSLTLKKDKLECLSLVSLIASPILRESVASKRFNCNRFGQALALLANITFDLISINTPAYFTDESLSLSLWSKLLKKYSKDTWVSAIKTPCRVKLLSKLCFFLLRIVIFQFFAENVNKITCPEAHGLYSQHSLFVLPYEQV